MGAENVGLHIPRRANEPVVWRLVDSGPSEHRTDWSDELAVFVGNHASFSDVKLPIAGRYQRDGDTMTFTPMFGFATGQDHVVRTRHRGQAHRFTEFNIAADTATSAAVTASYPSGHALPENTLRFYMHFSAPMEPHVASHFVRLQDEFGVVDDAAFMRFKQELWSADRTRLTILLDPGRIKRGVATHLDLGPALLEGKRYALAIKGGWRSADGSSVLPPWSKPFTVTAPLRERPDIRLWRWKPPRLDSSSSASTRRSPKHSSSSTSRVCLLASLARSSRA